MKSLKDGIRVVNTKFFTDHLFTVKNDDTQWLKNPHHDLAMLRLVFETENVQNYVGYTFTGEMRRRVVDVGGSTRLALSGLAGVALWPHIGYQDNLREEKRLDTIFNLSKCLYPDRFTVERVTFQQYMTNKPDLDALYVFTDTLYYIQPTDLALFAQHNNKRGVIGVGNMHVFKNSGTIHIDDNVYGSVFMKDDNIYMKVKGNDNVYEHKNYYSQLADHDEMAIKTNNGYIMISISNRIPLGATDYIKFTITYTDHVSISKISKIQSKYAMIDTRCTITNAFSDTKGLVLPKNFNVISNGHGFVLRRTIKGRIDATQIPMNERRLFTWEEYQSIIVEQQDYDFEVNEHLVNNLVSSLVTQKNIDADELKCALKKLMKNTDADPELYLIPILIEALTVTLNIEATVSKIAQSELVANINILKTGPPEVGTFGRILEKIFGINNNSSGKSLNPTDRSGKILRYINKKLGKHYENNSHGLKREPPVIDTSKLGKITKLTTKPVEVTYSDFTCDENKQILTFQNSYIELPSMHSDKGKLVHSQKHSISFGTNSSVTLIEKPSEVKSEKSLTTHESKWDCVDCKKLKTECKCKVIELKPIRKNSIVESEINSILNSECNFIVKEKETNVIDKKIEKLEYSRVDNLDDTMFKCEKLEVMMKEEEDPYTGKIIQPEQNNDFTELDYCNVCSNHNGSPDCVCDQCHEVYEKHWVAKNGNYSQNLFNKWIKNTIDVYFDAPESYQPKCNCHFCEHPHHYYAEEDYDVIEDIPASQAD